MKREDLLSAPPHESLPPRQRLEVDDLLADRREVRHGRLLAAQVPSVGEEVKAIRPRMAPTARHRAFLGTTDAGSIPAASTTGLGRSLVPPKKSLAPYTFLIFLEASAVFRLPLGVDFPHNAAGCARGGSR